MTIPFHPVAMIMLAGEQAAPNFLPVRHFRPNLVVILHTTLPKSAIIASQLALPLKDILVRLEPMDGFDVQRIYEKVADLLKDLPQALVNITGGLKPMSIGALAAAKQAGAQAFYVRSQGAETKIDLYAFDPFGRPFVSETLTLTSTISIDDYLTVYFGKNYRFTDFGSGPGEAFERAIHAALISGVDEIKTGWKHESGALDVDFIIRCNNQIGLIEAKTGKKALTADGIKQLALAGGQRFFGTYVKRFLIVDQNWSEKDNIRNLAQAIGIIPVELPGFTQDSAIDTSAQEHLLQIVHINMGKPVRLVESKS